MLSLKVKRVLGESVCWCSGGELLHVFSASSVWVTTKLPISPVPLSLGMSAFWGTAAWLPRERIQKGGWGHGGRWVGHK